MNKNFSLISYYYLRGKRDLLAQLYRDKERWGDALELFLDCGAHSAFTKGAQIDIGEYAKFAREHAKLFDYIASLDVVGDCVQTHANWRKLVQLRVPVCPVFTRNSTTEQMQEYFDADPTLICIGGIGMLQGGAGAADSYLRHVSQIVKSVRGKLEKRFHLFGLTHTPLLIKYKDICFSCDSSTALSCSQRFGSILIPNRVGIGFTQVNKKRIFAAPQRYRRDLQAVTTEDELMQLIQSDRAWRAEGDEESVAHNVSSRTARLTQIKYFEKFGIRIFWAIAQVKHNERYMEQAKWIEEATK